MIKNIIFKFIIRNIESAMVRVMTRCRSATSHHLSQCWRWSILPYGFSGPEWVKRIDQTIAQQKPSKIIHCDPNKLTYICKRHFQIYFHKWNLLYSDSNLLKCIPVGPTDNDWLFDVFFWYTSNTTSLVITRTNYHLVRWRIYASRSLNVLINQVQITAELTSLENDTR